MDISSLVGGLGVGSVLTLFLKEYLERRKILSKRTFEEKKEAYVAYLDVVMKSQIMAEKEAVWARVAALARVRLCASAEVIQYFNAFLGCLPSERENTFEDLIQAMRKDLWG